MGLGEAFAIIDKLMESGKSPKTSFIAASHLGRPEQKLLVSELGQAKEDLEKADLASPTLLAIGLDHISF
jgi:siroheme synthase